MEINADFSQRAVVHAANMAWAGSPMPGVERRMLDRIGDEVARATSIVRYAPGSRFAAHTHGGGEEFLVLDGVFEDEHGTYPAGAYVRNPPTSHHAPASRQGCILFVKLWQFAPDDRMWLRLDTTTAPFVAASGRPGVEVQALFADEHEDVRLECWAPGARIDLAAPEGLELLVLDGGFAEDGELFTVQSWLRLPAGWRLKAEAGPAGCRLWLKLQRKVRLATAPT